MGAKYFKKNVIGASFGCTVFTCILFLAACVVNILCSYYVLGNPFTPAIYLPMALMCIAIIFIYMKTTLTDPGIIPKRKQQLN